jgi:hypothetical protein
MIVVVIHQVLICAAYILEKAGTEGQALDARPLLLPPAIGGGRAHGSNTGMIIGGLVLVDDQRAAELDHVRVALRVEFVSGPVAADDNVLRHILICLEEGKPQRNP